MPQAAGAVTSPAIACLAHLSDQCPREQVSLYTCKEAASEMTRTCQSQCTEKACVLQDGPHLAVQPG